MFGKKGKKEKAGQTMIQMHENVQNHHGKVVRLAERVSLVWLFELELLRR